MKSKFIERTFRQISERSDATSWKKTFSFFFPRDFVEHWKKNFFLLIDINELTQIPGCHFSSSMSICKQVENKLFMENFVHLSRPSDFVEDRNARINPRLTFLVVTSDMLTSCKQKLHRKFSSNIEISVWLIAINELTKKTQAVVSHCQCQSWNKFFRDQKILSKIEKRFFIYRHERTSINPRSSFLIVNLNM